MAEILELNSFLRQWEKQHVLLDVRSEAEFCQGHIPGAVNLPLLNNEHRAVVGTVYKKKGRVDAVLTGYDLVGNKFGDFVRTALVLSPDKKIMLYCWRGGMRSNIMAWVLANAGFRITLLKGGYKSFRRWALEQFHQTKKIIVVGGRTGSGKTDVLKALKERGEQVIDLEALAHHKGSAFGGLGQQPQPRTEHFENRLAVEWSRMDSSKVLWIENESITIGAVKIPDPVFEMMRTAPVVELRMNLEYRLKRILDEYGIFPTDVLSENTQKLKKRLGDLRTRQAVQSLNENNRGQWVKEVLFHYDRAYDYGMEQRKPETVFPVQQNGEVTTAELAEKVLLLKPKISV